MKKIEIEALNDDEIKYFLNGLPEGNHIKEIIKECKVPVSVRTLAAFSNIWSKGYEAGADAAREFEQNSQD